MLYQAIALSLSLLLLASCAVRKLSLFSPPTITSAIWSIVFLAGLAFNERFYSLTDEAFAAWLIWFLINGLFAFFFTPAGHRTQFQPQIRALPFDYSYLLVGLTIWLSYRIWVVGSSGPQHFFLNLRLSSNGLDGFEPLGLIARFYPLAFALFIFENINTHQKNIHLRYLSWAFMLLYAVGTMGKFAVLTPVLTWCVIRGLQGQLSFKKLAKIGSATFLLMLTAHFVRAGEEDSTTLFDMLAIYIYSPIVALGYMDYPPSDSNGAYVFRFFYAIGHWLQLAPKPAEVILEYVSIPSPTNVYTAIHPFMHDYGLLGVTLGAFFFTTIFSSIFYFARASSNLALGIYAGISTGLVAQFIGDLVLTLISLNIQVTASFTAIYFLSRKFRHAC